MGLERFVDDDGVTRLRNTDTGLVYDEDDPELDDLEEDDSEDEETDGGSEEGEQSADGSKKSETKETDETGEDSEATEAEVAEEEVATEEAALEVSTDELVAEAAAEELVADVAVEEGGAALFGMGWPAILVVALLIFLASIAAFAFIALTYPDPAPAANAPTIAQKTVICLDPGHPSENAGVSSPSGVTEKSMNLMIANALGTELTARGYQVTYTKTQVDQVVLNKERADRCAAAGAALMFRIHMDSPMASSTPGKPGPFIEYPGVAQKNISSTSKGYATKIENALVKKLGISGKKSGSQPINGGVFDETKVSGTLEGSKEANLKSLPTVLIEMMTIDNANVNWLKDGSNQSNFVKGIADGIVDAVPPGSSSGGGSVQALIAKACELKNNLTLYKSLMLKEVTDCWGFVATVIKAVIDPHVDYSSSARDAPSQYFAKHPEKYQEIYPITSESQLKPGDLLFNTRQGSHASIYVGKGACSCPLGVVAASLNSHPPACSNWYPAMSLVERLK